MTITSDATAGKKEGADWVDREYAVRDGLDIVRSHFPWQEQMKGLEKQMAELAANENLSDVNRMIQMQMLVGSYSAISTGATNLMRVAAETCKKVASNIA
jgi:type III secretion protein F